MLADVPPEELHAALEDETWETGLVGAVAARRAASVLSMVELMASAKSRVHPVGGDFVAPSPVSRVLAVTKLQARCRGFHAKQQLVARRACAPHTFSKHDGSPADHGLTRYEGARLTARYMVLRDLKDLQSAAEASAETTSDLPLESVLSKAELALAERAVAEAIERDKDVAGAPSPEETRATIMAKCVSRTQATDAYLRRVVDFMHTFWDLPKPRLLVTVSGSAQDFTMPSEELATTLKSAIRSATASTDAVVLTGGTDCGVMKFVGEALLNSGVPLVGIAPWGIVSSGGGTWLVIELATARCRCSANVPSSIFRSSRSRPSTRAMRLASS
jgi:hypothetical protein